ncbi:MAG TPA: hypothetical protein VK828_02355 [Terriglobales bacterium]|jgi:hypothetical protein|nr:hypothetical protein [Terriglobales bacterium]
MAPPIACTLNDAEMRERRRTVLDAFRSAAVDVTSLPLGYAYHFAPTSAMLMQIVSLVDLERLCCPFLTFTIIVAADNQGLCLEVTGPPEAKPVIADFFGSSLRQ